METLLENTKPLRYKLTKSERLSSSSQIEYLFKHSNSTIEFPFKLTYTIIKSDNKFWLDVNKTENPSVMIMFSVSKRIFKRANKRNTCKRLMRETYRLNNHLLKDAIQQKDIKVMASISFIGKLIPTYIEVELAMNKILEKLIQKIPNE